MDERARSEPKTSPVYVDDLALLQAIAEGDEPALRLLYDRHMYWLASRLRLRLPADATEDVLQETFFAVWRGAGSYQAGGDVAAWIWGIARRQAALWTRTHGKHYLAAKLLDDSVTSTDDPARSAINRVDLHRALATLGPSARAMAQQVFMDDRSISDIASSLHIPRGTVKSRIFHLRRRLVAVLGKEHAP